MCYPSLEEYNQALQFPQLSLLDPELKQGTVKTTLLGLPLALCGGFALTYTLDCQNKKYAVRCFHKKSSEIEKRYSAISKKLQQINSPYFVEFTYQPHGIKVSNKIFPIIKMEWFQGITLGEFLEQNYQNKTNLSNLKTALANLAIYLERNSIAHGDIQSGNLLIADNGNTIKLIDYDGIFVDDLKTLKSAELGHRNFQHPKRDETCWDNTLDRFSFILLDVVLDILIQNPTYWDMTNSDSDCFLFNANDFSDPSNSKTFKSISADTQLQALCQKFIAVCSSDFQTIPTLNDFRQLITTKQTKFNTRQVQQAYISNYPVLDASDYELCNQHFGNPAELIGKIISIKHGKTKYNDNYVFINFGNWKLKCIKITIWKEGLAILGKKIHQYKAGQWLSVTGLIDGKYSNGYEHISITMSQTTKIQIITEQEAQYRLQSAAITQTRNSKIPAADNKELLAKIRSLKQHTPNSAAINQHPKITNQQILQQLKNNTKRNTQQIQPHTQKQNTTNTISLQQPTLSSTNSIQQPAGNQHIPKTTTQQQAQNPKQLPTDNEKNIFDPIGCLTFIFFALFLYFLLF